VTQRSPRERDRHVGDGIVCLCLPAPTLRRLELPPMVERNESRDGTALAVSIEAQRFARRHALPLLSIDDLVEWRRASEAMLVE
jgi:3,4-dihydroxy-2-butanone 4-phosphate synthase